MKQRGDKPQEDKRSACFVIAKVAKKEKNKRKMEAAEITFIREVTILAGTGIILRKTY